MTATDFMMKRIGDSLVPVAEHFREELHAFPETRQLVITVRLAEEKTDEMRAWLWFLVKKLREAGAWDGDSESCMDHLKIHAGYFATIVGAPTFGEDVTATAQECLDTLHETQPSVQAIETMARAILEAGPRQHFVPKSIARGAISGQNMSRLVERIEHFVASEWGINPDEFKDSARQGPAGRGQAGRGSARQGEGSYDQDDKQPSEPPTISKPEPTAREQLEKATLLESLIAFGFELGMIDKWDMPGVEGLKSYWEKAKKTKRIKHLYEVAPDAMKAIYDLAELNARGLAEKYDDEVRAIANEAVKP